MSSKWFPRGCQVINLFSCEGNSKAQFTYEGSPFTSVECGEFLKGGKVLSTDVLPFIILSTMHIIHESGLENFLPTVELQEKPANNLVKIGCGTVYSPSITH